MTPLFRREIAAVEQARDLSRIADPEGSLASEYLSLPAWQRRRADRRTNSQPVPVGSERRTSERRGL